MGTRRPSLASFAFVMALGCAAAKPAEPSSEPESLLSRNAVVDPTRVMPPQLVPVVDEWRSAASRALTASLQDRIGSCHWDWSEAVGTLLQPTSEQARIVVERASPEEQPWLVVAYLNVFVPYGIDVGWAASLLLEIPPEHHAWSSAGVGIDEAARWLDPDRPSSSSSRSSSCE